MPNVNVVKFRPSPNGFEQEATAESHYQDELDYLVMVTEPTDGEIIADAELWMEDWNEYDPKAVAVSIEGDTIAYLSSKAGDNTAYREQVKALGYPNCIGECKAKIVGGHQLEDDSKASYGVRLNIDVNNLVVENVSTLKKPEKQDPSFWSTLTVWKVLLYILITAVAFGLLSGLAQSLTP